MNQTSVPKTTNFLYVLYTAAPLHAINVISIILNNKLHQNVYFLLVNLSVSDVIYVLIIPPLNIHGMHQVFSVLHQILYFASILFTCSITLDRYIKVKYALTYETIATKKRLAALISFIWAMSILSPGILLLAEKIPLNRSYGMWVFVILCIGCTILLLFSSY